MNLNDQTIQQVKDVADLVEVISDFVTLKKRGQNMIACCPFHNEKSPSFSVSPSKGIYKCFGCGKGGDVLQFVMDIEGIGYPEAIKWLAGKYGIEIEEKEYLPHEEVQAHNERESLYIVLNFAKNYFTGKLLNDEHGRAVGLSYFKERGFSEETIAKFELGFSLEQWDGLYTEAVAKGFSETLLDQAGLIIRKEEGNKVYDRYRGRVIFPIHNVSGRVIAFGARILKADKNQPKYINSPETPVYHKSQVLYGLFQAKNKVRAEENCFLVEGYTDVISLHQAGIENVVSSSGTSLTHEQVKLISRYTNNITVLYDGDTAGIKASLRGIDIILEEGLNVKAVVFPDGEDPDSYARKLGGNEFKKYVEANTKDFITFKTALILDDAGDDPVKKADVIRDIIESISKIPDSIKRSVFYKQCSTLLGIDESVLIIEGNKIKLTKKQKEKETVKDAVEKLTDVQADDFIKPEPVDPLYFQEREAIRILLLYGQHEIEEGVRICDYYINELDEIKIEHHVYHKIFETIRIKMLTGEVVDDKYFIHGKDTELKNIVVDIVFDKKDISSNWFDKHNIDVPKEKDVLFKACFENIIRIKIRNVQNMIKAQSKLLQVNQDFEAEMNVLRILKELKTTEDQLVVMLGSVAYK